MIKNYFRTAFRNLWKNRTYSLLNIAGLAIGVSCTILIFLWVEDEYNFDRSFGKRDALYRIMENQTYDGNTTTLGSTPAPLAEVMKTEIPGIKNIGRVSWASEELFTFGDKAIFESGYYVDSSVIAMLTLSFSGGAAESAFRQASSLIISESMAKKFFGSQDPVGKVFKVNGHSREYMITGVFKDIPVQSTLHFDWLAPFGIFELDKPWLKNWSNNSIQTLVELEPGADLAKLNKLLSGYLQTKQSNLIAKPFLFPMRDWHLYSKFRNGQQDGGQIEYVRLFSIIAWIILIIACINFMNLATASSERRAKEVGVRKVMGAARKMLIIQFLAESLIMSFIAVILSIGIVYVSVSWFNTFVDKKLSPDILNPFHLECLLGIGLITGLIAGSYPAVYLSSFKPIFVLKGIKIKTNTGGNFIRKGLVVTQFAISVVLIISTVIIYQQIQFGRMRSLGYNKENLVSLSVHGNLGRDFDAIHEQLMATGMIENAALSSDDGMKLENNSSDFHWHGKDPTKQVLITIEEAGPQYISTMGMQIKEGRDFYRDYGTERNNIIINESMAKLLGNDGKIGTVITYGPMNLTIIGIIKDFVYNNIYSTSEPLAIFCDPGVAAFMTIRFKPNIRLTRALDQVRTIIVSHSPEFPFQYKFLDQEFDKFFKNESLVGKLSAVFSILAVFISCLGLFGLSAYMTQRRVREIGIRKVLGATSSGLAGLLSKDFLKLVGLAYLIALPVAWWVIQDWLQGYQYHTAIRWWVFLLVGLIVMAVSLLTVGFLAVKAARANPIKNIRTE